MKKSAVINKIKEYHIIKKILDDALLPAIKPCDQA